MDMDLEQKAIMRLREAADTSERFYKAPLIVTTSGGKDSSVCVALAEKAGIDFEVTVRRKALSLRTSAHVAKRLDSAGRRLSLERSNGRPDNRVRRMETADRRSRRIQKGRPRSL